MSPDEQRQAPRVMHGFIIRYRSPAESETGWLVSPLLDVSKTGARFFSERAFDVGTVLVIQLVLPNSKSPVVVAGRVVRTASRNLGMMELGVVFDQVDASTQETIEAAIAYFLRRQPNEP